MAVPRGAGPNCTRYRTCWSQENRTLSEFIRQALIFETAWGGGRHTGYCFEDVGHSPLTVPGVESLGLPPWRWPADPTLLFAAPGALIVAMLGAREHQYAVAASTPARMGWLG